MIIKDNFNKRSVEPLKNYEKVGKGSNNIDRRLERRKDGYLEENLQNRIISDLMDDNSSDDEKDMDKWDFFK